MLLRSGQRRPKVPPIYQNEINRLKKEKTATESVLPFIEDPDLYWVYYCRLDSINQEIDIMHKKAFSAGERNEKPNAFRSTLKEYQTTVY
jgi:hypothetical protein